MEPPRTFNTALQRLRRPVDLARLAGVSTQQIRNYERAGSAARRPPARRRLLPQDYDARHRTGPAHVPRAGQGFRWGGRAGDHAGRPRGGRPHGPRPDRRRSTPPCTSDGARCGWRAKRWRRSRSSPRTPWRYPGPGCGSGKWAPPWACAPLRCGYGNPPASWPRAADPDSGYRLAPAPPTSGMRGWSTSSRPGHYPLPQIRPILDGLRRTGSSAARRAGSSRSAGRSSRSERGPCSKGASHLHHYLAPAPTGRARRGKGLEADQEGSSSQSVTESTSPVRSVAAPEVRDRPRAAAPARPRRPRVAPCVPSSSTVAQYAGASSARSVPVRGVTSS